MVAHQNPSEPRHEGPVEELPPSFREEEERESTCRRHPNDAASRQRRKLLNNIRGTSVHGLSRAVTANSQIRRYFWIALFLAGFFGFSANFIGLIRRYSEQPILTQISYEHLPFEWPHITVCNPMNPIAFWNRSELKRKWRDVIEKIRPYPKMRYRKSKDSVMRPEMIAMSSINFDYFFGNLSVNSVIHSVSSDPQRPVIETSSSEYDRYKEVPNFHEAFKVTIETSRYPLPCYTLMPEAFDNKFAKPEKIQRIRLLVYVDQESYRYFNSSHENRKVYLYIGNRNYTQQTSTLFYVLPGTDSHFEITENRIHRFRNCINETFKIELYDVDMRTTHEYTGDYDDCLSYVSQRTFVESCDCYNSFLPIVKLNNTTPRLCFNVSLFNHTEMKRNEKCLDSVIRRFDKDKNFKKINRECEKFKKAYCWQSSYTVIRHTNTWDKNLNKERQEILTTATQSLENAPENATEEFSRYNLLILYFERKHARTPFTFEETEYPLSKFMSDIGGSLGLWLGVSVISVFELFDIVIDFVKLLHYRQQ